MVHLDGQVERLVKNNDDAYVDSWEITNGVAGVNNKCRHIVYVGGLSADGHKPQDTRTDKQKQSLAKFILAFHKRFPLVKIVGHNELAAKDCPSFNVHDWLHSIGI